MASSLYVLSKQISCVLLLLYLFLSVDSISFHFRDDDQVYKYKKDFQIDASISLDTEEYVAHAFYKGAVPIWDTKTRKLTDFSTRFTFVADTRRHATDPGGVTFFIAPVGFGIPPNSVGGYLGLYNNLTYNDSSKPQIVHVEFDNGINEWDPTFTHVGINVNSLISSNYTFWNSSVSPWVDAEVWISYDSMTKNLSVSWEYRNMSSSLENTFLSYQVDLRDVLPSKAIVGFSAANTLFLDTPWILSWEFNSSLSMEHDDDDDDKESMSKKNNGSKAKVNKGVRFLVLIVLIVYMAIMS